MKMISCLLVTAACCVLVFSGCEGAPQRQPIEGTVTLDGHPLEKGHVSFVPLKGTKSPTAGSEIVDGKFSILREKGTFVGRFRVEVTAGRPTGRKMADLMTGEPREVYEQFIADKYNTKSELEAEVKGDGRNVFEFAVISK